MAAQRGREGNGEAPALEMAVNSIYYSRDEGGTCPALALGLPSLGLSCCCALAEALVGSAGACGEQGMGFLCLP